MERSRAMPLRTGSQRAALRRLVDRGDVMREGAGRKGHAYTYRLRQVGERPLWSTSGMAWVSKFLSQELTGHERESCSRRW
jgi:hypothetical protein